MRGRIEFQRIEKIGIDPAQQHVEPLQAGDGADMNAVAADGEIVALDQQKAEIARQRRVLEKGFAEDAGVSNPIRGSSRSALARRLSRNASKNGATRSTFIDL